MENKTNVMRILEKANIEYKSYKCSSNQFTSAEEISKTLGIDSNREFKTLVTIGKSHDFYVFVVPSSKELDLKKAAKAVGEKNIEMIPMKSLLQTTGYIHGGCSPIGMKKNFVTVIDASARNFQSIVFSAGRVCELVDVGISDIPKVLKFTYADITK